jgi:aminopeptidase N
VPNPDGSVTSIWRQDVAIPCYLVSFAVGHFRRVDEVFFGPMELDAACIRRTFAATKSILSWLESRFGELPCAKFYQVLMEISTAMENESLVLYPPSNYALRSEAEREEHGWNTDRVVCHEATHSYFGNMVHIASWAHLWVKVRRVV